MDFSEALLKIKSGERLKREGWNGKNQYIFLYDIGKQDPFWSSYIVIMNEQAVKVPWLASQGDLLAEDWVIA
mgnify:CR=1 FL=1